MKPDTNLRTQYVNPVRKTLGIADKYNIVIFVIIVTIGLIFGVLKLTTIISNLYQDSTTTTPIATSFDSSTISKLNKLSPSDSNTQFQTATPGRQSPFFE